MIRRGDDAAELVELFKVIYHPEFIYNLTHCLNGWRRLFLCSAVAHNRIDLVTLLLSDDLICDLDISHEYSIVRPLFLAIYHDNVTLVELLVRAGSSISLKTESPLNLLQDGNRHVSYFESDDDVEKISAVELACILNRTDILKFMLSNHNAENEERYVKLIYQL